MRPHMPNKKELLNHLSTEITRVQNEPLWTSKIDPEYAYGLLNLFEETSKHCNFAKTGRNMNGFIDLKKAFMAYLDNIPRTNRQNAELPNTQVARW